MALIDTSKAQRFEIPHEPGEWMDIRPATAREMAGLSNEGSDDEKTWQLFQRCVVGWSYDAPLTPENLDLLDYDTVAWLNDMVMQVSGIRDEEEKKGSETGSSRGRSRSGASSRKK